jgi:Holliday junction resolvase RusA-like endonuclease
MTQRDRWAKRPCVLRYFAYRDAVQAQAFEQAFRLPANLAVTFILPMPESWSAKRRRLTDGLAHQGRPDLDNLVKAFLDAMSAEDGYVWRLRAEKRWGREGKIIVGVTA